MLKARGTYKDGNPFLFLGLTTLNVRRFTMGEPIRIPPSDMELIGLPPMMIFLAYGETEETILDELKAIGVEVGEIIRR